MAAFDGILTIRAKGNVDNVGIMWITALFCGKKP
jgi:hypothetical protein